jgi:hypothetical protein
MIPCAARASSAEQRAGVRVIVNRPVRSVAHAAVLLAWIVGWMMTWNSARANLYFEPTDNALKAAHDAVPQGILGGCLLLGAALLRLVYRPWQRVLLFAVLPAWVLVTFLAGPHDLHSWAWTLLLLPASIGVLVWGVAADQRRRASATSPRP